MPGETESEETVWEDVPPSAKIVVYETLREAIAKYRKDAALMAVVTSTVDGAGRSAPGLSPAVTGAKVISESFVLALELLMDADPDLCRDCGGYHDGEPPHPVNPKDLS